MNVKLAAFGLLLTFAWAFVESGDLGAAVDRFQKPKEKPSVRQIKVLSETADHRLIKASARRNRSPDLAATNRQPQLGSN